MEFKYLERKNHPLIDHTFELKIAKEDLPFKSYILPIAQISIGYISGNKQYGIYKKNVMPIKGLIVSGQFYGGYDLHIEEESYSLGFNLKPTALYKILNRDISNYTNKLSLLKNVDEKINLDLKKIFQNHTGNNQKIVEEVYSYFDNITLKDDFNTKYLEEALALIHEKNGLVNINDLLEILQISQKKLEVEFKKIIGLTPGKYIRQFRFLTLMKMYENNKIKLKDLTYMFDYYDESHFTRDFKFFLGETPKKFFKKDSPLIKTYLKE